MEHTLKLHIDESSVEAHNLVDAVSAFVDLLTCVSEATAFGAPATRWTLSVREGSQIINARPRPSLEAGRNPFIAATVESIESGLTSLERGEKRRPAYFDDRAMRAGRKLAQLTNTVPITIWIDNVAVSLSTQTAASIDAVLEAKYSSHGTLEGILDLVSERGRPKFGLKDALTGSVVNCRVDDEQLLERALALFGKRVSAIGEIRHRADGTAVSMTVDDLVPLEPPTKPVTLQQVWNSLDAAR